MAWLVSCKCGSLEAHYLDLRLFWLFHSRTSKWLLCLITIPLIPSLVFLWTSWLAVAGATPTTTGLQFSFPALWIQSHPTLLSNHSNLPSLTSSLPFPHCLLLWIADPRILHTVFFPPLNFTSYTWFYLTYTCVQSHCSQHCSSCSHSWWTHHSVICK